MRASPVGCLVLRGRHKVLDSLGLMNVSELPLQGKAYSCSLQRRYSQLFSEFEAIRKRTDESKLADEIDDRSVWRAIANQLCRRLMALNAQATALARACEAMGGGIEIVPCGVVARAYLRWARRHSCFNDLLLYGSKVCHPSKWGELASKEERVEIRALVDHICARSNSD